MDVYTNLSQRVLCCVVVVKHSFQDCNVTFNEQVKITQTFIDIAHMVHTLGTDHNLLHFSFKLKMLIQKVCRQRLHLVR